MPRGRIVLLAVAVATAVWLLPRPSPAPPAAPTDPGTAAPLPAAEPLSAESGTAPAARELAGPPVDVDVRPPAVLRAVRGFIGDDRGRPLPRASVRSAGGSVARADGAGWFRIAQSGTEGDDAALLFAAAGRRPEVRRVRWGERGVRVLLRPAGLVAVDVVDAETGAPVEAFAVQLVGSGDVELRADPVELDGPHAGGHAEARVAVASPALLRVVAGDDGYAPSALRLVELDPTRPAPVRVELDRWRTLSVEVSDPSGAAAAGALVEVLALPPGLACSAETLAVTDWRQFTRQRASVVFVGQADTSGRCAVRAPSRGAFTVRVTHPRHGAVVVAGDAAPARGAESASLRLRLPR